MTRVMVAGIHERTQIPDPVTRTEVVTVVLGVCVVNPRPLTGRGKW